MYFKARNGTYKRVPQIPNRFLDGEVGGMTVYYTSAYDNSKVTAFKPVGPTTPTYLPAMSLISVLGLPHACWRRQSEDHGRDYKMECDLLPMLQRPQLRWR